MKAFLSHSSRDKGVVTEVWNELGPANAELDSETFDHGLVNVTAIQDRRTVYQSPRVLNTCRFLRSGDWQL